MPAKTVLNLVIDFYDHNDKLISAGGFTALEEAVRAARTGLATHNARHAFVRDMDRNGVIVDMVHVDVLP